MLTIRKTREELFVQAAEAEYGGAEGAVTRVENRAAYGIVERNFIAAAGILHADPGELQATKGRIAGHGEQAVIPDDCQFGDNELCYVDN